MAAKQKTETVTLTKPHRHEGKDRAAGTEIQVTAPQKAWLKACGKIDAASGPGGYQPGKTSEQKGDKK